MAALNQSMLNRTESELDSVEANVRALKERKFFMQSQLDQINPLTNMTSATGVSILDPASRLKALESEYASLSARYSDEHPDIVKVKREIKGLREQTYGALNKKYSIDHPDVIKLKAEIAALEKSIAENPVRVEKQVMKLQPDNPAYISVQTQLKTVETEIKSSESRKKRLDKKLLDLEERISRSPKVEKEFLVLARGQENDLLRFRDIKARQMEAEIGQQLEKESKGESFILIDPAQFPEQPIKPNRIAIIFLSFILAVAAGLGVAILKEAMDGSIRGVAAVNKILTAAPLAVIPFIYNSYDLRRKQKINRVIAGSVIGSIVMVVIFIHFFLTPLDVLWFRGLRKAENVIGA